MSVPRKAVIRHLETKGYKFLKFLGKGSFGDVIALRDPSGRDVAAKIVMKDDIMGIEDQYWPTLKHPHVLQVYDVMTVQELDVKLYIMPILSKALDEMLRSNAFKRDANSFVRVKKWLQQTLSALQYLHSNGFAHNDIKADNIMIDSEDNAVLADFSGLNFTKHPVERLIAPPVFYPPECFLHDGNKNNVRGDQFDLWTFGLLVLNVMTRDYYTKKVRRMNDSCFLSWENHLSPVLQKALKESKFQKLMMKSFPKAHLTSTDVNLTSHFIQFVLNVKPEQRPNAVRANHHLLMKTASNPFAKDLLLGMTEVLNPFKKEHNSVDGKSQGDISSSQLEAVNSSTASSHVKGTSKRGNNVKSWFLKKLQKIF